jgi:hypothetical protein
MHAIGSKAFHRAILIKIVFALAKTHFLVATLINHIMRSKEIEEYKKQLKLSIIQREIIVGTLLGDGHLETQNNGKTYRLKIEHSTSQKTYVDWLYAMFEEWVRTKPQEKSTILNEKTYKKYWFSTLSHSALRFYAQQFYQGNKKVMPKLIGKLLTPRALAIWFMDDGSIKSHQTKSLILNTHSFSEKDLERTQEALLLKFKIQTKLRRQREGLQIFIPSREADTFARIIRPYMLDEMKYKLQRLR